jgi:hypothetical protein
LDALKVPEDIDDMRFTSGLVGAKKALAEPTTAVTRVGSAEE